MLLPMQQFYITKMMMLIFTIIVMCLYLYSVCLISKNSLGLLLTNIALMNSFNFRLQAGMILISLRKAFYKINHKTLLGKLYLLSFSKNTIIYFKSGFPDMSFRHGS